MNHPCIFTISYNPINRTGKITKKSFFLCVILVESFFYIFEKQLFIQSHFTHHCCSIFFSIYYFIGKVFLLPVHGLDIIVAIPTNIYCIFFRNAVKKVKEKKLIKCVRRRKKFSSGVFLPIVFFL